MKAKNLLISLVLFFLPFNPAVAGGAAEGASIDKTTGSVSEQAPSLQPDAWQKEAEKSFEAMCDFIQLDTEQLSQARKLFDSRLQEMKKVFSAVREGSLSQTEARTKLAESFLKHREKFEALLSSEQRAKLQLWETSRPVKKNQDKQS